MRYEGDRQEYTMLMIDNIETYGKAKLSLITPIPI